MNGTLQITIKESNPFSKVMSSPVGGFGAFTKYSVYVYIDGAEIGKFSASKIPHQIPVAPGEHLLQVTRKRIGKTNANKIAFKVTDAILSGALTGEADGDGLFSAINAREEQKAAEKGSGTFVIADGQTVRIEIQHDFKGNPIPVLVQ